MKTFNKRLIGITLNQVNNMKNTFLKTLKEREKTSVDNLYKQSFLIKNNNKSHFF